MKTGTAGIKVGITVLLAAVIGYAAFKFVGKGVHAKKTYVVYALLRDATGLAERSRVQIAGLVVGEIYERRLEGNLAHIGVRMNGDVHLYSNATIFKRSASLLGEFYLEIDPGTPSSIDAATHEPIANYRLEDCPLPSLTTPEQIADCNRVKQVVEAVTVTDVLVQVNEVMPVLRDILRDVHRITEGPMQDIAKEVSTGIKTNSDAAEKLLNHMDEIAINLKNVTNGPVIEDLTTSMRNVREITESIKGLVGTGEGQVTSTGEKVKKNLDKITETLDKLNKSLDNMADVTGTVARGEGTIGKLVKDDTIARNAGEILEDAGGFVKSLTRLQTIVGIKEEYYIMSNSFKTYVSLRLQPRPDKYYLLEFVDDPRGSRTYNHTYSATSGTNSANPTIVNTDNWTRSSSFRFSFQFAKRIAFGPNFGGTGRLGIIESTGGVGLDLDTWKQRIVLKLDLFDFMDADRPRLRALAAIDVFKHIWLLGGVDDILNPSGTDAKPTGATCGPATPTSWCKVGRDYFVGAQLQFNDDDLRALLAVGASALGAAVK